MKLIDNYIKSMINGKPLTTEQYQLVGRILNEYRKTEGAKVKGEVYHVEMSKEQYQRYLNLIYDEDGNVKPLQIKQLK